MATGEKNPRAGPETEDSGNGKRQEAGTPKKQPQRPPPPEKPLPDDCCGSGCVRCVWDIYYDELEEYDKLYGGDGSCNESKPS